jgi:protein-disulfide isomerase
MKALLAGAALVLVLATPGLTAAQEEAPLPAPPLESGVTEAGDYYLGRADAPVSLDMYGDFQCPVCGEFARGFEHQVRESYLQTGQVKLVWHDFPWIGDESFTAAAAARCAGAQSRFWEYHDFLYANQWGENLGHFSRDNLKLFAVEVGLDAAAFDACLDGGEQTQVVRDNLRRSIGDFVRVTPTFRINDRPQIGLPPPSRFASLLDQALAQAGR